MLAMEKGCKLLVYPSNFAMRTGELHWDTLNRSRSIDNQCFIAGCQAARCVEEPHIFQSWGYSKIYSPWGKCLASALKPDEEIFYSVIDLNEVDEVRSQIPYKAQKRADLYKLSSSK